MTPIVKLGQGSYERTIVVTPTKWFKRFEGLRRWWCAGWPIARGALCSIMALWLLAMMARAVDIVVWGR